MSTLTSQKSFIPKKIIQRIALILATGFIVLFIISLHHRHVTLDDAWFAEQAYWFAHDGFVHSNLFEGLPVFANQILVYHKLHIWQGALVYKLFGWHAYNFKAIAIPYLLLFLALLYYLLKQILPAEDRNNVFVIFLFLFFCNHLIFQEGFEYRPEIPMMCVGFLSYLFLRKAQLVNATHYAALSGVMAGITALFHLNGLIFIAAGGFLLLTNRHYKLIFWFGLGAAIGFSPYFYHLTSIDKLQHFIFDLTHDPAVHKEDRTLTGMLFKLVTEYQRFTHHIYEFSYLILFILALSFNWTRLTRNNEYRNLLFYILFLTFFMALITTGNKTSYLINSMPYVLFIVSTCFTSLLGRKKSAILFLLFLTIYTLTNLDRDHGVFVDNKYHSPQLYASIMVKYHIKPGDQVFAPAQFIFNEIGVVKIQAYTAYLEKYRHNLSRMTIENVLGDVYRHKKSFAILNATMLKELQLVPQKDKTYAGYRYLGRESDLYIFKRVPGLSGHLRSGVT